MSDFIHKISIKPKPEPKKERRKGLVHVPDSEPPLGRRLRGADIRFYDLGQVNHQAPDAEPVWRDHPVLFVPGYTHSPRVHGGSTFAGVRFNVQPFTDTHYQAYSDMMFNYPVTEWTRRYRRIRTIDSIDITHYNFDTDMRISLRDSQTVNIDERFLPGNYIGPITNGENYNTAKESSLNQFRWVWEASKDAALYRGLDQVTSNISPPGFMGLTISGGYFGFSTGRKDTYKVTTSRNPSAPDVGTVEPRGVVEVFLMPQIGLFLTHAYSSDWKTTHILGAHYQINPRHKWPRYQGDSHAVGSGGQYGGDAEVADYIDYMKQRSTRAISWTMTGSGVGGDLAYSLTEFAPGDWSGLTKWAVGTQHDTAFSTFYFGMRARGGPWIDSAPSFASPFVSDGFPDDDDFGTELFRGSAPFLVAVIKMGSAYYYVWDISYSAFFGNTASFHTRRQRDRFRISRGISWDPAGIDTVPPQPRDGTGVFYDH